MGEWFPMGEWYPTDRSLPSALLLSGEGAAADLDLHLWSQQCYVDTLAFNNQVFGIQLSGHATEIMGATIEATSPADVKESDTLGRGENANESMDDSNGDLVDDGSDSALPDLQRDGALRSTILGESAAFGIFVNQRSLVPLTTVGSSAVALSQLRNVRVTGTRGPGVFVSRVALVQEGGAPYFQRAIPLLDSHISATEGPGVLAVDSVVDVIGTEIKESIGLGIWGLGFSGVIANCEISDTRIGNVMDVELGHGLLLARSPSRPTLFSGSGLTTVVNNTIRRSSARAALFDGACEIRAHLLFREDSLTNNGSGDQGFTVYDGLFDDCIEMLETTGELYTLSRSTADLIPRPTESELSVGSCELVDEISVEVCNGFDDDCDGLIDEGTDLLNVCGGCGLLPIERCDGIDNNCDGVLDIPGCVPDEQ